MLKLIHPSLNTKSKCFLWRLKGRARPNYEYTLGVTAHRHHQHWQLSSTAASLNSTVYHQFVTEIKKLEKPKLSLRGVSVWWVTPKETHWLVWKYEGNDPIHVSLIYRALSNTTCHLKCFTKHKTHKCEGLCVFSPFLWLFFSCLYVFASSFH